jgi:hypothetical protein
MKRLLVSALFVVSQFGNAQAQNCVFANERAAFELVALKNTLMVAALSCGENNEYNDFMTRFQPYMATQQSVMDHYFQRMNGGTAQADEDEFLTALSNEESQESLNMGPQYCPGAGALFDQILSLRDEGALQSFAATNAPAQGGPGICGATASAPAAPALPPPEPVVLPGPPASGPAPAASSQAASSQASIAQRASEELVVSPDPAWQPPAKLQRTPLHPPPGVQVAQAGKPGFSFSRRTPHYAIPARHVPSAPAPAKPAVTIVQI